MSIVVQTLAGNVTKVLVSGRIDAIGAAELETELRQLTATRTALLVDMAGVAFLASMGLRSLVAGAQAMRGRGRMVLLSPQRAVAEVLAVSGVDNLIPVFFDEARAISAVGMPPG
jgi:anti-sigma B factor antagonist